MMQSGGTHYSMADFIIDSVGQVHDGTFVMAGNCEKLGRLLKKRENRVASYVHCLNYQLHVVVVHALSPRQGNH